MVANSVGRQIGALRERARGRASRYWEEEAWNGERAFGWLVGANRLLSKPGPAQIATS